MDLRVERHLIAVPAVVSSQAGLVAGLARDVTAGEKEIADLVSFGVGDDSTAGCFDGVDGRLRRKHRERCRTA